jgi:hypothetical protein
MGSLLIDKANLSGEPNLKQATGLHATVPLPAGSSLSYQSDNSVQSSMFLDGKFLTFQLCPIWQGSTKKVKKQE